MTACPTLLPSSFPPGCVTTSFFELVATHAHVHPRYTNIDILPGVSISMYLGLVYLCVHKQEVPEEYQAKRILPK